MTSKELAYMEDAINKERFIIEKITIIKNQEMEEKVFELLNELMNFHKKKLNKLEKVLEVI